MVMALGVDRHDQARRRSTASMPCWPSCSASALTSRSASLNGVLVTWVRLPPFIVTLGTLNIAFAITQIYSQVADRDRLPDALDVARQHLPARQHVGHLRHAC